MNHYHLNPRPWVAGIWLLSAFLILPLSSAFGAPTMDGEKDAEYTSVATAPADKLVNDPLAVPTPIDDTLDPRAKTLVATGLSATNTGADLYIYVDMPNLDLNVIEGEWGIAFHLQGANDAIEYLGTPGDPYAAKCNYLGTPAVNAVLKSNMAGFKHDYDGNQGWAYINSINNAVSGWNFDTANFTGSGGWTYDVPNNLVRGIGNDGGAIVYKGGKGIEVKIPLKMFTWNQTNTPLTTPKPGDGILMQFYDNMRDRADPKYPRGSVYSIPYEAAAQGDPIMHDYASGVITTWAPSYTLKTPKALEVTGAALANIKDLTHFTVSFSGDLGDGAATTSNYNVVNQATSEVLPVTSAVIDPIDATRVILGTTLPFNTTLTVTVSNVKDVNGTTVSSTVNTAQLVVGTAVQFNMFDPYGLMAAFGNDPLTSLPYALTMTGDPISWANDAEGASEIAMTPVAGDTGHFQSAPVIVRPGVMGFKYRAPHLPNWDNWNALNPNDRRFFVPTSSTLVQANDNAAGSYGGVDHNGGEVTVTFTLIDRDNLAAGRPVYVTGIFNGWSGDATGAIAMPAVAGQPNTYSVAVPMSGTNGADITMKFKYLLIYDDPANPGTPKTEWNLLNPFGDHWFNIKGTGSPAVQNVTDFLATSRALRILRAATGLGPAPGWSDYYGDLDADKSGSVTLLDAVKALKS